jgi:hypothetical protein
MIRPPRKRPGPVPPRLPPQIRAPWRSWNSVVVSLAKVPKEVGTLDLWKAFKDEGNIVCINIFDDGTAKLRFRRVIPHAPSLHLMALTLRSPPPSNEFWEKDPRDITRHDERLLPIRLCLAPRPPEREELSPVRPGVKFPAEIVRTLGERPCAKLHFSHFVYYPENSNLLNGHRSTCGRNNNDVNANRTVLNKRKCLSRFGFEA